MKVYETLKYLIGFDQEIIWANYGQFISKNSEMLSDSAGLSPENTNILFFLIIRALKEK
jgi:hypothetical protein